MYIYITMEFMMIYAYVVATQRYLAVYIHFVGYSLNVAARIGEANGAISHMRDLTSCIAQFAKPTLRADGTEVKPFVPPKVI